MSMKIKIDTTVKFRCPGWHEFHAMDDGWLMKLPCLKTFPTTDELAAHVYAEHRHRCAKCLQLFSQLHDLCVHSIFTCICCHAEFNNQANLFMHQTLCAERKRRFEPPRSRAAKVMAIVSATASAVPADNAAAAAAHAAANATALPQAPTEATPLTSEDEGIDVRYESSGTDLSPQRKSFLEPRMRSIRQTMILNQLKARMSIY